MPILTDVHFFFYFQNLVVSEPPSPTSANMAVVSTVLPGARSASPSSATSNGPSNSRCCETGRPIFSDPITGQSICSCQYDLMNYQRLATVGISAGSSAIPLTMYNTPYSAEAMAAYFPALGGEQSSFYPNPVSNFFYKFNIFYKKSQFMCSP